MTAKGYVALGIAVAGLTVALQYRREIQHRFFPRSFWNGEVRSCEANVDAQKAKCSSLQQLIEIAGETGNQSKVNEYYAMREVEVPDNEAWNKAEKKVESGMSTISNDLVKCQAKLQKKEQELEAARAELAKVQ